MIGNQIIKVSSGQTLTGRNKIAEATGLNSSKVERLLKVLEIEQQIEQQTFTKYRIITVTNWCKYQMFEQQIEQQVNNKRTTSEHKQEGKEGKECKEENLTPPPQERMTPSEAAKLLRDYSGLLVVGGGDWTILQDICKTYAPEFIKESFQVAAASKPTKFLPYLLTVLKGENSRLSPPKHKTDYDALLAEYEAEHGGTSGL